MRSVRRLALLLSAWAALPLAAQDTRPASRWNTERFAGLAFRSLGPGFASGRIADLAIHPDDPATIYVAAGSGGVWKTTNAGVTWTPIFDAQPSYSIGCVTIDPHNPHRIWVGTGENVGGRHVGFGDGVYRSDDGGGTWQHLGLAKSEHISEIVVHPHDPHTVWVAAQGPLWAPGGERGVYVTTDGGATWGRVLGDDEWVGATDLAVDPRNPDRIYAATWQRHRTVAAYFGTGPGSGLHVSDDGGATWTRLTTGLPEEPMGKIGLAMSPQDPDVLYAAIELKRRTGAVYRSTDRGASWEKRSETVSGGTGPHYYQELYASPHAFDRIYLADVRIQVSDDGGATFRRLAEANKHSDNHAMAFRADDPDYLLVGTDGGVYESFDLAKTWRFFGNLPLTQYYKVAVDDAQPFYNVYGGTQDNGTHGGPSRTDTISGIRNADWRYVLDWDGHQPATEPGNPAILYAERQQGMLSRIDTTTGEATHIQPQPAASDPPERFNWDAPILVSPHQPSRIWFASQRVWRSDDRGDSWRPVSGDLTRDLRRIEQPIQGGPQGWDGGWDLYAMSQFSTITSLAESPQAEGLVWAGTDDGLLNVTEDGGANWRRIAVETLPGVPERAFVNDVRCDLFDADTVYVALDHHKSGDFRPYLYVSADRGRSWRSMVGDLPERLLVWRIVQDHVDPELFFLATEFGLWFTTDAGARWTELTGGLPNISFRDVTIQRREDDLVAASFGRGFFVLDDLGPLRNLDETALATPGLLFQPRDAWWYVPKPTVSFSDPQGFMGADWFVTPNPPFGAVFTYHLADDPPTAKQAREAAEVYADGQRTFPGWDSVETERRESAPRVWLTVSDDQGRVVRRVEGPAKAGFHRVAWDLRYPLPDALPLGGAAAGSEWDTPKGLLVAPGVYSVTMALEAAGEVRPLGEARNFTVKPLSEGALPRADAAQRHEFTTRHRAAIGAQSVLAATVARQLQRIERMREALGRALVGVGELDRSVLELRATLQDLDAALNGLRARGEIGAQGPALIGDRLFALQLALRDTTRGPVASHFATLEIVETDLAKLRAQAEAADAELQKLARQLVQAGAPWIEGDPIPPARLR